MERARAVKTIEELMVQFERSIVEAGCGDENAIEALDDSVEALESLRQGIKDIRVAMLYEDTGLTPQEIRELKERDTAVLLGKIMGGKKKGDLRFGTCPKCKRRVTDVEGGNFCQNCGQRLKWEE